MTKTTAKLALVSLLAAFTLGVATPLPAQEKKAENPPASPAKAKRNVLPLHGKIAAADKTAMTITIGQSTVQITSDTKIEKDGKPATFDDAKVGEEVVVRYRKDEAGKMVALSVRIGPKPEKAAKPQKREKKTE
jgi:hypothetical protein